MSLHILRSPSSASFISSISTWQMVVLSTLMFWLSGSFLLDVVIMPGMYAAGMMETSGFATAGYSIFWLFNRVEILCAGLILTGVLALRFLQHSGRAGSRAIVLASTLMAIAVTLTYILTPQMSALGMQLSPLESAAIVPETMNVLHGEYFGLELLKFAFGLLLLGVCAQRFESSADES